MLEGEPIALGHALSFYVMTLWSRTEPHKSVRLLQIVPTRITHAPWCAPLFAPLALRQLKA